MIKNIHIHGRRSVKHYPVTEGDMWNLLAIGLITAILISASGFFLSYGCDIYKDLSLSSDLSPKVIYHWSFVQKSCFWLSGILFVISMLFILLGWHKIRSIKSEMQF